MPPRRLASMLLVAGSIAAVACERSSDPDPSSGNDGAPSEGASLSVSSPRHDFGKVLQGQELEHTFVVQSTGSEPLRIEKIDPGFRCTGRAARDTVDPGQQAEVSVTCRPNLFGTFSSTLVVHSNARDRKSQKLELSAEVTPLLRFERDLIDVRVPHGEERIEEVRLTGTRAADARLTLEDPPQADLQASVLPAQGGKAQGLRLRCEGKHVGTSVHRIVAATSLDAPNQVSLSITCRVVGTLEVSPTNPYINLREPGAKVRLITVRSSQPDFTVTDVRVLQGPFSASVAPTDDHHVFHVKVTADERQLKDRARAVTGKLLIVSNDRTEPHKEVPLLGFGKPRRAAASRSGAVR